MATNIKDLLRDERANVNVIVSLADLREFAAEIVEQCTATTPATAEVEQSRDLMTRDEVCDYLGVTKPTLHRWNKSGYLTCVKIGSKVRYRRQDIKAFAVK
jgi:excisionase family DNA binding protein